MLIGKLRGGLEASGVLKFDSDSDEVGFMKSLLVDGYNFDPS
jgi:hypothetical protein